MEINRIRVVLADDIELVCRSAAAVLSCGEDIEVVGTASNGKQLIELCEAEKPDVAVVDIQMPVMNGIAATRYLREHMPEVRILILTTFDDEEYIKELLIAGIDGYILKSGEDALFINAVKSVHMGINTLAPVILDKLSVMLSASGQHDGPGDTAPALSNVERRVAELIAKDYYNKDIAAELKMTYGGVRNVVSRIYRKLGVSERDLIREYVSQYEEDRGRE